MGWKQAFRVLASTVVAGQAPLLGALTFFNFFLSLLVSAAQGAVNDEQLLITCWEQLSPWVTEDPIKNWGSSDDLSPIRKLSKDGIDHYFWYDSGKSKIYAFTASSHGAVDYAKNKKLIKQVPPEAQDLNDGIRKPTDAMRADFDKLRPTFKTDSLKFCFGMEVEFVAGVPIYSFNTKTMRMDYKIWKVRGPTDGECTLSATVQEPDDFSETLVTHMARLVLEKANRVSQAGLNGTPDTESYLGRELQKDEALQAALFTKSAKVQTACQPVIDLALEKKWMKKSDADEAKAGLEFTARGWKPKIVEQKTP